MSWARKAAEPARRATGAGVSERTTGVTATRARLSTAESPADAGFDAARGLDAVPDIAAGDVVAVTLTMLVSCLKSGHVVRRQAAGRKRRADRASGQVGAGYLDYQAVPAVFAQRARR